MVKLDGFIKNENCFLKKSQVRKHVSEALSTLMCSQKYAFSLSSKTHRSTIRVYTTVLMLTAHTKTFQNDRIARRDVIWTSIQTQKALIFSSIVFILMRFRPFSTRTGGGSTPANTIRGRFRFYRLSRAFSNRCVLEENAQRVSVGENLNTSKCTD